MRYIYAEIPEPDPDRDPQDQPEYMDPNPWLHSIKQQADITLRGLEVLDSDVPRLSAKVINDLADQERRDRINRLPAGHHLRDRLLDEYGTQVTTDQLKTIRGRSQVSVTLETGDF